jgi:hypothetical protein
MNPTNGVTWVVSFGGGTYANYMTALGSDFHFPVCGSEFHSYGILERIGSVL